jgi:hypothetical protein
VRGWKAPTPAAMKIVLVRNWVPREVATKKRPSCCCSTVVTSWPKWNVAPKGSICLRRLSVSSWPVHTGTAGMS